MSFFRSVVYTSIVFLACFVFFIVVKKPVAHASSGDARERGAIDFQTKGCERCHSISGIGGDRAPDLENVGSRRTGHQIKLQVVHGGHGMPPFGGVLTKNEVKDLVSFLTSCRTDKAPGCRQLLTASASQ